MHGRRACAHDRGPARVRTLGCLGRPVATGLLGCSIATESSLSRQRWFVLCRDRGLSVTIGLELGLGHLGRDMNFEVVTGSWAAGTFVCRDTDFMS